MRRLGLLMANDENDTEANAHAANAVTITATPGR
jgi:hypothetical protein